MNAVRKLMCWLFALSAVLCVWNACHLIVYISHRHDAFQSTRSWTIASVMPVSAAIYSVAWWTVWQGRKSAKLWGTVGSLMFIVLAAGGMLYSSRSLPAARVAMLAIGIAGFVAFIQQGDGQIGRTPEGE